MQKESDDLTFDELIGIISSKIRLILTSTVIFLLISLLVAFYLPNKFESELLVAPANSESKSDSLSSGFSGLAGLAGISLDSSGTSKVQEALAVLKSRKFISDFIIKYELKPEIIAAVAWDSSKDSFSYDQALYDSTKSVWLDEPSDLKTAKKFLDDFLAFSEDKKTGFIKMSVTSLSPKFSYKTLEQLLLELNEYFREQAINEASKTLNFLEGQLKEAKFIEIRKSIFDLMQEQIKIITLAEGRDEYLLRTLDPPLIPELKSSPARLLIIVIGTLAGFVLSIIYSLLNHAISQSRSEF